MSIKTDNLFHLALRDCNASGYAGAGAEFIVKAGSIISTDVTPGCSKGYVDLRASLIKDGIIVDGVFTQDYTFDSPTAAAVVVVGRTSNGRREWTTLDGRQYGKVIGH